METRVVSGDGVEEEALVSVVTVTSLHQSIPLRPPCRISPTHGHNSSSLNCLSVFWKIRIVTVRLFLFSNLKLKLRAL